MYPREKRLNISIDALRQEFPITERCIYLDHASTGPLPRSSAERMAEFVNRLTYELPDSEEIMGIVEETREEIAKLVGAGKDEIALTKNTTSGILIAIGSIEFAPGDNVIIQKGCFPTNQYPWHYLLPEVEKRTLDPLRPIPEQLATLVDDRTRAVSVDLVDYLTGVRIDLGEVKGSLRPDVFLVVDGIQAVGAVEIDLGPVDFMACGSGKWLLSPHGTGFIYVKKSQLERVRLSNIGWLSSHWDDFTHFEIKPLKQTAARYEEGTYNYPGLVGMNESMKMFNRIGIGNIASSIRKLCDFILEGIDRNKFTIITPKNRAGIVTVRPACDVKELKRLLDEKNIVVSERMGCLRISPHFYNTEVEIEELLEILNSASTCEHRQNRNSGQEPVTLLG
ncbi:MAG TPA: aminotransferase class V-fold PLP-dependent enzyme [bacterium (Candidatus Stahlbacteria)]|nr:aminotransferase class V-fold PLP-dependent enzyme [Candidatus Stahlbacteria bacterium]